jgi:hypothetical protein
MLVYSCYKLRQLSLCLGMHLAMHLLHAQGFLAEQDPSVPIYMPAWVARGVNVAQVIHHKKQTIKSVQRCTSTDKPPELGRAALLHCTQRRFDCAL